MKVQINIIGETKNGMSYSGMAFGQLMQANLLEAQQAKTAGLALYLGTEAKLKGRTLEFFVNFMAQRFPTERSSRYILEWADRITAGTAWAAADNKSRAVLLKLAREMNLKNIPDEWSECT